VGDGTERAEAGGGAITGWKPAEQPKQYPAGKPLLTFGGATNDQYPVYSPADVDWYVAQGRISPAAGAQMKVSLGPSKPDLEARASMASGVGAHDAGSEQTEDGPAKNQPPGPANASAYGAFGKVLAGWGKKGGK
jgi:hypothetical protein